MIGQVDDTTKMSTTDGPERGLSVSTYIRYLIRADDAASRGVTGDITALIGLLGSQGEPTDIARNKHEMVAQAFAADYERKQRARRTVD